MQHIAILCCTFLYLKVSEPVRLSNLRTILHNWALRAVADWWVDLRSGRDRDGMLHFNHGHTRRAWSVINKTTRQICTHKKQYGWWRDCDALVVIIGPLHWLYWYVLWFRSPWIQSQDMKKCSTHDDKYLLELNVDSWMPCHLHFVIFIIPWTNMITDSKNRGMVVA